MKRCFISAVIFTIVVLFIMGNSKAEEPPILEQVVVTASRVEEKKKDVTANVTIIKEEEIKNSSAKDLGELLAEKGVGHIRKYPGALTSVGIRGFRTETHGNDLQGYVLVLVDGRRAGTGNVAKLLTKNIERIEIIRGPGSVLYGSAAVGGVINVITKRGEGKPSIFLDTMLGSYGYEEATLGLSGKYDILDFSASFTKQKMDDYETAEGTQYHNTGYDSIENTSLNLGVEFYPGQRVGIIYRNYTANEIGIPGYLSANDLDDYAHKKNWSVDFSYEGIASNMGLQWRLRYFTGRDKDKWVDPIASNPDGWDNGIPSERITKQKGGQAQVSYTNGLATLTAGADWVNYQIKTTWDPQRSEFDNPAYFLLGKLNLFDQRLVINAGLRYDLYEVEIKEGQGREEDDKNLSPRLGASFSLTEYLKLRANYAEAFKMPDAQQLAADYTGWWTRYVGNPDLDPEKSKTYEVGIDLAYRTFSMGLTYFYTDFRDKIQPATTPSGDSTWENVGEATISGLEADFSIDVGAFLDWPIEVRPYASLVYITKRRDKETHQDLLYVSDATLSYGITVSDGEGFSANLNVAYVGEQRIQDWESGLWPAPVISKGGFSVANFTVTKPILELEKYGRLVLRGEIQNLFNKDYSYVKGYPMPGRSFFLGLKYEF